MNGHGSEAGKGEAGPAPDLIGACLGNYRISSLIGKGGMGSVFLAEHVLIGRKVAIKLLDPQIASHKDAVSRFFVEARSVNEIRHPNIVEVTDLGTHGTVPFIVMEFLEGQTLEERLGRRLKLGEAETVGIARQVASALGAAHERGLVHRDLKPANIMISEHPDYPNFVKVLDFGIAKLLGDNVNTSHRTEVGSILGTPAYMSPEQCLGDVQLDHRSDVYSLGVILFLMVTGRLPYESEAVGRLILSHVHDPIPKPSAKGGQVSPGMSHLIERALAKKPHDRFQSMRELRQALDALAAPPARSLTPVVGVPVAGNTMAWSPGGVPAASPGAVHVAARAAVPGPVPVPVPASAAGVAPGTRMMVPGAAPSARPAAAAPVAAPVWVNRVASGSAPVGDRPRFGATFTPGSAPAANLQTLLAGAVTPPPVDLFQRLEEVVVDRIARKELRLPDLPANWVRCLQVIRDPTFSFGALSALLREDPRLSSHLVRRANSDGTLGKGVAVTSEQAMARLGSKGLLGAIFELSARPLIDIRNQRIEDELRRPWQNALAGAILAERLARIVGKDNLSAEAYLAALLRQAGIPLLAQLALEIEWEMNGKRPGRRIPVEAWVPVVLAHQRKAAAVLLEHWELPPEVRAAVLESEELDEGGKWSLRNLVWAANVLADSEGFYLRREAQDRATAAVARLRAVLKLPEYGLQQTIQRLKEAVRLRQ